MLKVMVYTGVSSEKPAVSASSVMEMSKDVPIQTCDNAERTAPASSLMR
jgi:hypothetical protein